MTHVTPPITTTDPAEAVKQWFTLLSGYCATVDYDAAESIVAEDVASFGTATDIVSGRTPLRKGQWESIWGNITDFKMDLDNVYARGSGDQAWGMVTWTSTGYDSYPQAVPPSQAAQPSHWNAATESGSRCIPTSPSIPAHRRAPTARGCSFSSTHLGGKDYEGQA